MIFWDGGSQSRANGTAFDPGHVENQCTLCTCSRIYELTSVHRRLSLLLGVEENSHLYKLHLCACEDTWTDIGLLKS